MSFLSCVPKSRFSACLFQNRNNKVGVCKRKSFLVQWRLGKRRTVKCEISRHYEGKVLMGRSLHVGATKKVENDNDRCGIGIVNYLQGKNFFITGGTGFLGKVLVEKILRSVPDIGKIYLMINAKDMDAAMERVQKEIIEAEIFKCLKQKYGGYYESYMLNKLIPVVGNMCEPDLNLEGHIAQMVAGQVDIIINSAANTSFHGRYDVSVKTNTRGPSELMTFAKKCSKLKLFVHISTAYVNGERKGRVMEKPFRMGETLPQIDGTSRDASFDVENEINLALSHNHASNDDSFGQYMKHLGLQRARQYGWQNTYIFTKAMGEMMINHLRENVPVVIIRPAIVESTYKDPFPGWIEGNRMMDPLATSYGKGLLKGFVADPKCPIDVVPADMVINATLAAMAKHGMAEKSVIHVYQVASSVVNPMTFKELADFFYEHYKANPYLDSKGRPITVSSANIFNSIEKFSSNLWKDVNTTHGFNELDLLNGKLSKKHEFISKQMVAYPMQLAKIYEPFTFYGGRFDNSNMERLLKSMSEDEKEQFEFDVKSIDWKEYIADIHLPGLRRHVLKGRGGIVDSEL